MTDVGAEEGAVPGDLAHDLVGRIAGREYAVAGADDAENAAAVGDYAAVVEPRTGVEDFHVRAR